MKININNNKIRSNAASCILPVPLLPDGRILASYLPWPRIWSNTFFSFSRKLILALFALWTNNKKIYWNIIILHAFQCVFQLYSMLHVRIKKYIFVIKNISFTSFSFPWISISKRISNNLIKFFFMKIAAGMKM